MFVLCIRPKIHLEVVCRREDVLIKRTRKIIKGRRFGQDVARLDFSHYSVAAGRLFLSPMIAIVM